MNEPEENREQLIESIHPDAIYTVRHSDGFSGTSAHGERFRGREIRATLALITAHYPDYAIRRRGKIELMAGGASDAGGFYPTMLITPGFW